MALNKYKIGDLITIWNAKNEKGEDLPFYGINRDKEFMPTVANTEGLDKSKYKVVSKGDFVFSGMQTGRDNCIRIAYYNSDKDILVSPAYTTFYISSKDILPEYFFMIFKSSEKDRYGAFLSDGSIRANLDWDVFLDMDMFLPSVEIQQKYVNIYKSLNNNLISYQSKIDELKLVCNGYIEKLRRDLPSEEIGSYITKSNISNTLGIKNVLGVESSSNFVKTKAKLTGVDLSKYNIVYENDFAFNPSRINLGSIALRKGTPCIVSPMYEIFRITNNDLLPEYLYLWLTRKEFLRSTSFYAIGTVRDIFDYTELCKVKIPIPEKEVQEDIIKILKVYKKRQEIAEKLKNKINEICPILIRGAIKEGE